MEGLDTKDVQKRDTFLTLSASLLCTADFEADFAASHLVHHQGSTGYVVLLLSRAARSRRQRMASDPIQAIGQAAGTILVVDGEPAVLETAKVTLERHGYLVLVAKDGADGIATYANNAGAIRLVISDMDLPILSSAAMIRSLERLNPKIRIISTSTRVDTHRSAPPPSRAWLPKPYTAQQLVSTVHAVLRAG